MQQLQRLSLAIGIPFAILSAYALAQVGFFGILDYHRHSPAGWQVFTDLVIGMILLLVLIYRDARRQGRTFWPYAVLTLVAGSFGPLAYLLLAPRAQTTAGQA